MSNPPSKDDEVDPTSLGNVVRIFNDDVTGVHVLQALNLQKEKPEMKIGEAMVELGTISEKQLKQTLKKQRDMRRGKYSPKDVDALVSYATRKTRTVGRAISDTFWHLLGRK